MMKMGDTVINGMKMWTSEDGSSAKSGKRLDGPRLFAWGCGEFGQHGHGQGANVESHQGWLPQFSTEHLGAVQLIACGATHTLVVTETNRIFSWGHGHSGQLGCGDSSIRGEPVEVQLVTSGCRGDVEVAGVACGSRHSLVWTRSGRCFSFGNNFYAQLGYDFQKRDYKANQCVPYPLNMSLMGRRVEWVSCGERHSLFLFEDRRVAACGGNTFGQLGVGGRDEAVVARVIEDLEEVIRVACGTNHSLAVAPSGRLYAWGYGRACGCLTQDLLNPETMMMERCGKVMAVAGGGAHSLAMTDNGNVYSWGSGQEGQLGHGQRVPFSVVPRRLACPPLDGRTVQITAGDAYSAAVTAKGELYMWGRSSHVMGAGSPAERREWVARQVDLAGRPVRAVSCGSWHAVALTAEGPSEWLNSKVVEYEPKQTQVKQREGLPLTHSLMLKEPEKRTLRNYSSDFGFFIENDETSKDSSINSLKTGINLDCTDKTETEEKINSTKTFQIQADTSVLSQDSRKHVNHSNAVITDNETALTGQPSTGEKVGGRTYAGLAGERLPQQLLATTRTLKGNETPPTARSKSATAGVRRGLSKKASDMQPPLAKERLPWKGTHSRVNRDSHLQPLKQPPTARPFSAWESGEKTKRLPITRRPIYSSGSSWRDVATASDPVLSAQSPAQDNPKCTDNA
ncbi:uncharacterized protein LOC133343844 isoform X1 [Lethenteron reissneri]|uniref:uncharacterized protein LOC133343844 isoform X1 n=1 Tax=Lethenteron reissneri TaxID=7753 RepID=UPI002AB7659A|nr:uncharacterized protein LOC133343844 isoform X1 [Lethenteron reissneri]XP_061409736.1 uncharacterized protein LOC133343844 isoform X1 [Lethenteron reissneri]